MDANRLKDEATRDLLFKIIRYLEDVFPASSDTAFLQEEKLLNILKNQDYYILQYDAAGASTYTVKHKLGFTPVDFIITYKTGVGNVTINHALCTKEEISFTTTGACEFRLLYGKL